MTNQDHTQPSILWFRDDLRLSNNKALQAALEHKTIMPVYIHESSARQTRTEGRAAQAWRHRSLKRLRESLQAVGSDLYFFETSNVSDLLRDIAKETGAKVIYCNKRYAPKHQEADREVWQRLAKENLFLKQFSGALLWEPEQGVKANGSPYLVYTPYWRNFVSKHKAPKPFSVSKLPPTGGAPTKAIKWDQLPLSPKISWDVTFWEHWEPGENAAKKNLKLFMSDTLESYNDQRDIPSLQGTSRLSPYLHFGEITPGQIWHEIEARYGVISNCDNEQVIQYAKELVWREFAYHLLHHFPTMSSEPLRPEFNSFPWRKSTKHLQAWQKGLTGYPIVDAGMRELWQTGWMHNRVRMVVASFLVKHLLLPWQWGEDWFWDTLVDADAANNAQGWQWSAGCGADAAPYFRIFNPIIQGKKFDPKGAYIKKWVPELAQLPQKYLHTPWEADAETLKNAGICLGQDYPEPVVNHAEARIIALQAYDKMRNK